VIVVARQDRPETSAVPAVAAALRAKAEPAPARMVLKISSPELVIGRLRDAEICSVRAPWSPWYWTPAARLPPKGMVLLR
jgi:hypothetical protein